MFPFNRLILIISRSESSPAPRKVCVLLGNGVAIYCDKRCSHGQYNTRGQPIQGQDQEHYKFSPVIKRKELISADTEVDREELALNKMDGSPLGLMGTFPSRENKVFLYREGMERGRETSPVRRDRPGCGYCKD